MAQGFWQQLPIAIRDEILSASSSLEFKRGESLYRIGETPQGIYVVERGLVGQLIPAEGGTERLLRLFRNGQYFGHRALFARAPYHVSAICLEPSVIRKIGKDVVYGAIRKTVELQEMVMESLARELRSAELQSVRLTESDFLHRVAGALIFLSSIEGQSTVDRALMEQFCAIPAPALERSLLELRSRGLLGLEASLIHLLDRPALVELAVEHDGP